MAIEVPDWYRTVALVGVDITGAPVVVLLDSTGAIISVMKGEYAGTLKNVQVDAQGRMIMIPTDPLDIWGNAISMGNLELAGRLGRVIPVDGRGNVILIDDYEEGFSHVLPVLSGAGAAIELSTTETRFGAYSAKLTGGSDGSRLALLRYYIGHRIVTRLGVEFSFRVSDNVESVQIAVLYYDGAKLHEGNLYYDPVNNRWRYLNSGGTLSDLKTSCPLGELTSLFYPCKLVLDVVNDLYVRAVIPGGEEDMSTLALCTQTTLTSPMIRVDIGVTSTTGNNGVAHVDGFIVTQNEPS